MGKTKELPQTWERRLYHHASHLKGLGYMLHFQKFNIPGDTIGSIIRKIKTYGTAENLLGYGWKPNISSGALSNLVRTSKKTPRVCLSGMQKARRIPFPQSNSQAVATRTGNLDRAPGIIDSLKRNVFCWQIKPWWSLDFSARQWSEAHRQVNQRLVEKMILEWPSQSPHLNPIKNIWWDLKKSVAKHIW